MKLRTAAQPVVDTDAGSLRWERGDCSWLHGDKIAVISSWSPGVEMSLSFSRFLYGLRSEGFQSLIVSTCEAPGELSWPHGLPDDTVVSRRPNIGYDFGSWAAGLAACRGVAQSDVVLLTNDSLVGPFESMETLFERAEKLNQSVVFLTESLSPRRHGQSFFMLFRDQALEWPELRGFFDSIAPQRTKDQVIAKYEVPLAALCERAGLPWAPIYAAQEVHAHQVNPTLSAWRQLIEAGAPFLKRQILLEPRYRADALRMQAYVMRNLRQDVADWLPVTSLGDLPKFGRHEDPDRGTNPLNHLPTPDGFSGFVVVSRDDSTSQAGPSQPDLARLAPGWLAATVIEESSAGGGDTGSVLEQAETEVARRDGQTLIPLLFTEAAAALLNDEDAAALRSPGVVLLVVHAEVPDLETAGQSLPMWADGTVQSMPESADWPAPSWDGTNQSAGESSSQVSYSRMAVSASALCQNKSGRFPGVYWPGPEDTGLLGLELVDYTEQALKKWVSWAASIAHFNCPGNPMVFAFRAPASS